jgi:hypothetical protein
MASANQLMQMGLANNADELENVAGMAVRLGTAMGRDATQSMEEFALLLANQSIPRLDTFGISAGRVRTRIKELRDANEGMTRETAFMTAVMEEGRKSMARLGDQAEDNLLAFEQLEASVADFKTAVGKELAPVIADLAGNLNDLVETGNESEAFFYALRTAIRVAAQGGKVDVDVLRETIDDARDTFQGLEEDTYRVTEGWEEFGGVQAGLKGKLNTTRNVIEEVNESLSEHGMEAYAARLQGIADAAGAFANQGPRLNNAMAPLERLGSLQFDNQSLWNLAMASGASAEALGELAVQLGIADEKEIGLAQRQQALVEAFANGKISAEEFRSAMGKVRAETNEVQGAIQGVIDKLNAMPAQKVIKIRTQLSDPSGMLGRTGQTTETGKTGLFEQSGTPFFPGGMAMMGEGGPELAVMPRGTRVFNATETKSIFNRSSNQRTVWTGNVVVRGAGDPHATAQAVIRELRDRGIMSGASLR